MDSVEGLEGFASTFGSALARPRWKEEVKRSVDVVLAAVLLVLAAPFLLVAALAIKLEDGGPVFYRSGRLSRGGREFDALKLRTMHPDAEARLEDCSELAAEYYANVKLQRDPRITQVGSWLRRFSIDEVPQLINVLLGDMSLVGPRIVHPWERPKLGPFAELRLSVPQGLTGLWQVSGRSLLNYEDRLRLDREYIENWSLGLDFQLLVRTIPAILSGRGAV